MTYFRIHSPELSPNSFIPVEICYQTKQQTCAKMFQINLVVFVLLLWQANGCIKTTFEGTAITGLKNIKLTGEITDFNYFSKVKSDNVISIHHITGCIERRIEPTDELEEVVAIQIRDQKVPIMYEGAIQNLPLLHSLHIVSSQVNILKPHTFKNLPSLKIIKMVGNNIDVIPENVFSNLTVEKLILFSNHISYITPKAFDNNPNLKSVNLGSNNLGVWDTNWFANCPQVEFLSLKFNQISTLPNWAFRNVRYNLERLYLSNNKLIAIDSGALLGLNNLTDLALNNNYNLTYLEESTFVNLSNLKMLNLAETSIHCLSKVLLESLNPKVLLWVNNLPLREKCVDILHEWAQEKRQTDLTLYKTLRNATTTSEKPTKKMKLRSINL